MGAPEGAALAAADALTDAGAAADGIVAGVAAADVAAAGVAAAAASPETLLRERVRREVEELDPRLFKPLVRVSTAAAKAAAGADAAAVPARFSGAAAGMTAWCHKAVVAAATCCNQSGTGLSHAFS